MTSLTTYGVTPNTSAWRAYQVSNSHCHPSQVAIRRYIGQISNLNQLQSLPNHGRHMYIVVSHQVISVLTALVEKWERDTTLKAPLGLTGIKLMVGK